MTAELERLRSHIDVLSKIDARFAGSEGERKMLHAVQERLPDGAQAKIEGFVDHPGVAFSIGLHAALLVLAGVLGLLQPGVGAIVAGLITISLIGEGTGRFGLLRWLLSKTPSYNLVIRGKQEGALGTVVIATTAINRAEMLSRKNRTPAPTPATAIHQR